MPMKCEELASILQRCCVGAEYDGKNIKVNVRLSTSDLAFLNQVGIKYDEASNSLDITSPKIHQAFIYYNASDFVKRFNIDNWNEEKPIVILNYNDTYCIKQKGLPVDEKKYPIFNFITYKQILNFIKGATDFNSYINEATREIILISEKGAHRIGYNPADERACELVGIVPLLSRLSESFKSIEFQGFFKEAVMLTLERFSIEERFYQLVLSLSVLLDVAERDYQLYIRKFSFDKIKSKFKEEKKAYFDSIEKNVESINRQVATFPLTFSASAFASYQVKDKPVILVLILFAYFLYTFIAWQVLKITKTNIANLKDDLFQEAKNILGNYNLIYKEFKPDFKKILVKIKQLNSLVCILKTTLIILLSCFVTFSIYQIIVNFESVPILVPPENLLI